MVAKTVDPSDDDEKLNTIERTRQSSNGPQRSQFRRSLADSVGSEVGINTHLILVPITLKSRLIVSETGSSSVMLVNDGDAVSIVPSNIMNTDKIAHLPRFPNTTRQQRLSPPQPCCLPDVGRNDG
eukprot:CAMPEP_0203769256 /NCGR_PEP_ID=MMETSP0099_2-20121227/2083_1 /ASSEMBLY_ACC=CAM_ASM_000209 /TAXON_ID=96639 /ORGANISM=" , Strain NY0313808BC1" /LENGTH=125 /DNA_ID=CAMNT_0050666119 /DNA_START=1423 /DNA_END=1797 /DNA_ORIENTATION=-